MHACAGQLHLPLHVAGVVLRHEPVLMRLQERQSHPVQDLGALAQKRVPHAHRSLQQQDSFSLCTGNCRALAELYESCLER